MEQALHLVTRRKGFVGSLFMSDMKV